MSTALRSLYVDVAGRPWTERRPGVFWKVLWEDGEHKALLVRYAPSGAPRTRDIWPTALVGAVLLWGLSVGFASFIDAFGRYNVVYGSLAAVVVFLFFVYLAANIVLLTAAFAAEWRGVRTEEPGTGPPGPGIWTELLTFLRGLWVPETRQRGPED